MEALSLMCAHLDIVCESGGKKAGAQKGEPREPLDHCRCGDREGAGGLGLDQIAAVLSVSRAAVLPAGRNLSIEGAEEGAVVVEDDFL